MRPSTAELRELAESLADARVVLIGEATHGTSDYYLVRSELTKELFDLGFTTLAVEGDHDSSVRAEELLRSGSTGHDALRAFDRWPSWLWGNWETAAFFEWMRSRNLQFRGLDVYGLGRSLERLFAFAEERRPDLKGPLREAARCFDRHGGTEEYAPLVPEDCRDEVITILSELTGADPEHEQDARVLANAETYYRALVSDGTQSWNVRETHMIETLERLLEETNERIVVWAHNTHVGDGRGTDMHEAGLVTLGQLARDRIGDVYLVGFSASEGEVIAAKSWGHRPERMATPAPKHDSWDALDPGIIITGDEHDAWRGHRAIGVVYRPGFEQIQYVPTNLAQRYDVFISIERSGPLHPFELARAKERPELYPWGL